MPPCRHLGQCQKTRPHIVEITTAIKRSQQQPQRGRIGELRSTAKATLTSIDVTGEAGADALDQVVRQVRPRLDAACLGLDLAQGLAELAAVLADLGRLLTIGGQKRGQHPAKRWPTPAIVRRIVRPAEERLTRRQKEHRQRPAPAFIEQLQRLLIELIDIGMLLSIDLDADKVLVQLRRCLGILERLMGHDVAPVTGRVSDRQQHRLVLGPCPRKGFLAPRIPVDGIFSMLTKIGTLGLGKTVGHGSPRVSGRS
jgi:hypothetical protein